MSCDSDLKVTLKQTAIQERDVKQFHDLSYPTRDNETCGLNTIFWSPVAIILINIYLL